MSNPNEQPLWFAIERVPTDTKHRACGCDQETLDAAISDPSRRCCLFGHDEFMAAVNCGFSRWGTHARPAYTNEIPIPQH